MQLLSPLLALLDAIAKLVLAQGSNEQLELVQQASCSLLLQMLDDCTTALCLPYTASSVAFSRAPSFPPADSTREHGLPDVHQAHALGNQLHPKMLGVTVQLLRWLRTGPCSSLAAASSSQQRLEWLSGALLIAAMQCFGTKQPHGVLLPPVLHVSSLTQP